MAKWSSLEDFEKIHRPNTERLWSWKNVNRGEIFLEIGSATNYLSQSPDQLADIRHVSSMMIANVIYSIVFGKSFKFNDAEFHTILKNLDTFISGDGPGSATSNMPKFILKILDPKTYKNNKIRDEALQFIKQHIYKEIEEHETTFDKENIRDFIDVYVQVKTEEKDNEIFSACNLFFDSFINLKSVTSPVCDGESVCNCPICNNSNTVGNIYRVILDLFLAGSETTSNTINWAILYMIEYPDVQKHCYDEIKEKYGDRPITWADKGTLVYVEATLLEIQRISNIAQMTLPHTNEIDTTIRGFHIPKRTIIQGNLYSANMDKRQWDRPHMFNPDRFIENGKLKNNPQLVPFGLGPRVCMGEPLAKMEMFLVFTNLVQRLHFSREDDNVPHTFEAIKQKQLTEPVPYMAHVKRHP